MIIGTLKEKDEFENRVSITPETCKNYLKKGLRVLIEKKSGIAASFTDSAYEGYGAEVLEREEVLKKVDILINVSSILDEIDLQHIKKNTVIVGGFYPYENFNKLKKIAYSKGFLMVSSSPFTRSSFHADEDYQELLKKRINSNK